MDNALSSLGGFGKFQFWVTNLAGYAAFIDGAVALSMVFLTQTDANGVPISGTVTAEWNPDNGPGIWAIGLANSMFFVGWFCGAALFGIVADYWGRKIAYCAAALLQVSGCVIASNSPSFTFFAIARLVVGTGVGGLGLCAWVIAAEFWSPESRTIVGTLYQTYYAAGIAIVALEAYFISFWRTLILVTSLPLLIVFVFYRNIPESPRWLLSKHRKTEAIATITRLAVVNTGKVPEEGFFDELIDEALPEQAKWTELFKSSQMRRRSLIMAFSWATVASMYYGISLYAGKLTGSIYVNSVVAALSEFPACFLAIFLVKKGRRSATIIFLVLAGICSFLVMFTESMVELVLAIGAKLCISGAFTTVYVYSSELFPTPLRGRGTGFSSQSARVGAALAPLIGLLGEWGLVIWGLLAVFAAILVALLPETVGKPLPDTVEEVEQSVAGSSVFGWCLRFFHRRSSPDDDHLPLKSTM